MKRIAAVTLSLAAAFGLAGCENAEDIARKPDVVESFVTQAKEICPNVSGDATYDSRLRERLMLVTTRNLEGLRDRAVSICLDKRLSGLTLGWADASYAAIYDADSKVLGLHDNGKMRNEMDFLDTMGNPYNMANTLVYEFSKSRAPETGLYYAGFGAKNSIYWRTAENADQDTLTKNPFLKEPLVAQKPR